MTDGDGLVRIDPSSPVYQKVARLYRIALDLRPGGLDRWNGELYARHDDKYGGLARDGSLRLSQDKVLQHLTGGEPSTDPGKQAGALATVLHEADHARTEIDAPQEPNAVRQPASVGFNEGVIELRMTEDFGEFARLAGYEGIDRPDPEYEGAALAVDTLLDRVTNSAQQRRKLLDHVADQPVTMGWDAIADHIVRTELSDVVPPHPEHQQAARAHLVNQLAIPEWYAVQFRPELREMAESAMLDRLERGIEELDRHYQRDPTAPYPARVPNPMAVITVGAQGERERAYTRGDRGDVMRFLDGTASARGMARGRRVVGEGVRGMGGAGGSGGGVERVR